MKACKSMLEAEGYIVSTDWSECETRCEDFVNTTDVAPRVELAREIFEEIEKLILRYYNETYYTVSEMECGIAILKEKYTKGGE